MIKLGIRQTLTIVKKVDFGAYLADTTDSSDSEENRVLLPMKEVPYDACVMDPIEVFVYKDSKDRRIATTRDPYVHLGETASLKVKDIGKIGAFLDWGLEKDLFLPFAEQKRSLQVGDDVTVSLYVDKSGRLCATMWMSKDEEKTGRYESNAKRLMSLLKKNKGFLPINDKSDPSLIKEMTDMSKNDFKKAVGNLYKNRAITIEEDGIFMK